MYRQHNSPESFQKYFDDSLNFRRLLLLVQPSPEAFSARSIMDSTVSCDVTERYSPALSQTSRGQRVKRERLGTRLLLVVFSSQGVETTRLEVIVCYSGYFDDCCEKLATKDKTVYVMDDFNTDLLKRKSLPTATISFCPCKATI